MTPVLEVRGLSKTFPIRRGLFRSGGEVAAVRNVSFSVGARETVALVGGSGSGKTTVARCVLGLVEPTAGEIVLGGSASGALTARERAGKVQMIFQDPFASLNPKLSAGTMLEEAVRLGWREADGRPRREDVRAGARRLLESVGMPAEAMGNYPHQFSGGQRQRLGIARALAMKPYLIVADEPVSALDLSIQAQILNLLADLQNELGISYLLIAHDLSVVEHMADRVLILHGGALVEEGGVDAVFASPKSEAARALLRAAPVLERRP